MRMIVLALALLTVMPARADTLYDQLGGHDGIARIASRMVDLALQDDRIKASFADTNIDRLKGLIAQHSCQITGGPCVYKGRNMAKAHASLHLRDTDFNAIVEDLQQAMDEEGIPFGTQNKFLALLAPMHRDVVNPDGAAPNAAIHAAK